MIRSTYAGRGADAAAGHAGAVEGAAAGVPAGPARLGGGLPAQRGGKHRVPQRLMESLQAQLD